MAKKVFNCTDLGPGDGGKGGVVHALCCLKKARWVIKEGGGQGNHGVRTFAGKEFNYSYFGCGSFEGVSTYISPNFVMEPGTLFLEGMELKYRHGITDIFDYLTVDENTLCCTPFHGMASRLREMALKHNPRGTVGTGIGEAYSDSQRLPELEIRVKDLNCPNLVDRLEAVRLQKLSDLSVIIANINDLWPEDYKFASREVKFLQSPYAAQAIADDWRKLLPVLKVVDLDYLKQEILSQDGTVIVEKSHGVLTDRHYGFYPHTSKLRTLPCGAVKLLKSCDYDGQIVNLGISRAYNIRHGAGPMVTEDANMVDKLLPGSNKKDNRWQGKVRVGPLDAVMLRYAIEVCGGPASFDGLAITWFDQIAEMGGVWKICDRYTETGNPKFFSSTSHINVYDGDDEGRDDYQERLGRILRGCRPVLETYEVPCEQVNDKTGRQNVAKFCNQILEQKLGIPIRMMSFGPTEKDKVFI